MDAQKLCGAQLVRATIDLDRVRRRDGFAFDKSWGTCWNNLRTLGDQAVLFLISLPDLEIA